MHHRILVVDDSSTIRAYVRAGLESGLSAEVEEARNGFEALQMLPRQTWTALVVDINMPDINGLELLSLLKRNPLRARTPVLLISTEASEKDRQKGMDLGASGFLAKPFTPDQLVNAVRMVSEERL